MISRFRDRFGTAGLIVAVLALVAAVAGTALAAGGLTKQQEKQVIKIAKKYAGKDGKNGKNGAPGAQGAQGNPGPAGAPGKEGPPGAPGEDGENGKSVVILNTAPGCPAGGKSVEVEGSGVKKEICNGEEGAPGVDGEDGACSNANPNCALPPNATETGTWGFNGKYGATSAPIVPISFSLPLAAPLGPTKVHLINSNGEELVINETNGSREFKPPTGCGSALTPAGTVSNPAAASGHLCIYSQKNLETLGNNTYMGSNLVHTPASGCEGFGCLAAFGGPGGGTSVAGALVEVAFEAEEPAKAWGTWAVTGAP
ncbi:MAG TPA: hypothetical protein VFI17_06490 [Solirubrobacterales bacterium]|nr:hypothetical protein [Solirubrobacterales bacterium]